jgi:hypothetical protein
MAQIDQFFYNEIYAKGLRHGKKSFIKPDKEYSLCLDRIICLEVSL